MRILLRLCALLALPAGLVPNRALALPAEEAAAARALAPKLSPAIIELHVVVSSKMTFQGRTMPREQRLDRAATVVTPAGLAVTALSGIDPSAMQESILARYAQLRGKIQLGETGYKEVKMRLSDGTEIPARVVLKDVDLDLAFVAPLPDPAAKRVYACVSLQHEATPAVLEDCFFIAHSTQATGRIPILLPSVVSGITNKPHRLYLISAFAPGVALFDLQGRILGLCVAQVANGHPVLGSAAVLPADTIQRELPQAQAEAAKPPPPAAQENDNEDDSGSDMDTNSPPSQQAPAASGKPAAHPPPQSAPPAPRATAPSSPS